jgi:hypothetical protein
MARREYQAGRPTTLASAISSSDTSFTITSYVNWPDGADYDFWVTIDAGTAQEERVLCSARTDAAVTVASSGRGVDGTTASAHAQGATVWPSWSATDADEANAHVNAASGVHNITGSVVGTTDTQGISNKTITASTLTSPKINENVALSATATELNYIVGTTASVQTQIDSKAPLLPATNAQTGTSYTLVLADNSKYVEMNNASANTLTVPLNSSVAFPVGTQITIIQTGAGTTTISPTAGVTVDYYSLTGAATRTIKARWAAATLIKRATDTWVLIGNLG